MLADRTDDIQRNVTTETIARRETAPELARVELTVTGHGVVVYEGVVWHHTLFCSLSIQNFRSCAELRKGPVVTLSQP